MKRIFFAFFLIANFAYAQPAVNEKILKVDSQNGTTRQVGSRSPQCSRQIS